MPNVIERAYQLAGSGKYRKIRQIERELTREGHTAVADHLSGRLLRSELNALMRSAHAEPERETESLSAG